jgi:hypothetical protein
MKMRYALCATALAAALSFTLGAAGPAFAQKKGATDKRSACIAKARAENPGRMDGNARNAAFNRCMRGG